MNNLTRISILIAILLGAGAPSSALAQTPEERQAELTRKKEEARKKAEERRAAKAAAAAGGSTGTAAGGSTSTAAGGSTNTATAGGGGASAAATAGAGGKAAGGAAGAGGKGGAGGASAKVEKDAPLPAVDIETLRKDRADRRKSTVERLRRRWGTLLANEKGVSDLKLHARRVAFLQRIRLVAEGKKDAKTVEAVDVLLTQEDDRHAKAMNALREGALPSGTSQ